MTRLGMVQLGPYRSYRQASIPDQNGILTPFARSLQSGMATVGANSVPPVGYLSPPDQNPLGGGMGGWQSSTSDFNSQQPASPAPSTDEPGGLLGMLLDHLRNN